MGVDPTLYGLPAPNHKLFEAHPTQSVRAAAAAGLRRRHPEAQRRPPRRRHRPLRGRHQRRCSTPSSTPPATTSPSRSSTPTSSARPDNDIRLYKRMFKPGIDDLVFVGFAQAIPTLFPFVECQARLLAAYAVGRYALAAGRRDGAGDRRRPADVRRALRRPAAAHPAGRLLPLRARHPRPRVPGGCQARRTAPPSSQGNRMTRTDITFDSDGVTCSGWHFPGEGDRYDSRPVVVMGHGFGGTKDSGLEPFADRLSRAGLDVLAFDYRGFGARKAHRGRRFRSPTRSATSSPRWPPPSACPVSTPTASCCGVRRCRAAMCCGWPPDRDDIAAVIAMTPLTSGARRESCRRRAPRRRDRR